MNWLYIKVLLILLGSILAINNGAIHTHSIPPITKTDLIIPLIFGIIAIQFLLGIQASNKYSDIFWEKPKWNSNFFNLKQPVQFFYFGSWFLIISAIPTIMITFIKSREYMLDAMMPFLFGIGLLIGVVLSIYIFKKKYK